MPPHRLTSANNGDNIILTLPCEGGEDVQGVRVRLLARATDLDEHANLVSPRDALPSDGAEGRDLPPPLGTPGACGRPRQPGEPISELNCGWRPAAVSDVAR